MNPKCTYCSQSADWRAQTANGPRDMCQRHYSQLENDRRAQSLAQLTPQAAELIRASLAAAPAA